VSKANSILLLEGDAEAQLLADAQAILEAVLPIPDVQLKRAWATRPDWLDPLAAAPPAALRRQGLLPDLDPRELLAQDHLLVVIAFLPAIAMPALVHKDGGGFLAHRGLRAQWSSANAGIIAAECTEQAALDPGAAALALEPVIESLQARGSAVALCTAFRHVNEPLEHRSRVGAVSLREQIRRCNLEVAGLSRRTGCFVLDLDRPLAQEGGAALPADCFGGGERAAELALDEFAALVLDALPDAALMEGA
jgi:hypothetical protein